MTDIGDSLYSFIQNVRTYSYVTATQKLDQLVSEGTIADYRAWPQPDGTTHLTLWFHETDAKIKLVASLGAT